MTIDRYVFPLSAQVLEQRPDGRWRMLSSAQAAAEAIGELRPEPEDWEDLPDEDELRGKAQLPPHPSNPRESWWMLLGRGHSDAVGVTTADGVDRPVTAFGPLWVCEWLGPTQAATVMANGRARTMFDRPRS
jgi:hypothetical protein